MDNILFKFIEIISKVDNRLYNTIDCIDVPLSIADSLKNPLNIKIYEILYDTFNGDEKWIV